MPRTLISCAVVLLLAALSTLAAPAKRDAPNLKSYFYQRIFPLQRTVEFSFESYNLRHATLSLYRTDIEMVIPNAAFAAEHSNDRRNPATVAGLLARMTLTRPVKTLPIRVKDFYVNAWQRQQVKLPGLAAGVYIVEVAGGGVSQRTWFAVSSRALLVQRSPDVISAWLVNATSGQPAAGVPLALYDVKGRALVARTGPDGLVNFPAAGNGALWVAARSGDPAFAQASAPVAEKPYQVYLYTDRPIYRPGQLVHFRGTVRAVSRGAYRLPKQDAVRVQIKTRGDTVLYDERLPLNDWGSFAGDFQLAPEPPLGRYSLETSIGDFREYAGFAVENYRKPDFAVTATAPAAHLLGGGTVSVTIGAQYFFGSPVSGGRVSYTVHFQPCSNAVPARIVSAAGLGSDAIGNSEEDFEGQGRLDDQGKLVIEVPTRRLLFDRMMTVEAEVTDLSLRSRRANTHVMLDAAEFRLWLETAKPQYQPGDTVTVRVNARDYNNIPASTSAKVTLIEYLTDREGRQYEQKTPHEVAVGKDGRGETTFSVVRPGNYTLQAWARDGKGNPVYAETEFYVSKEKPQPQWPTLETSLDKSGYAPGDTARLRVRTSMVGGWALLTVAGERLYVVKAVPIRRKEFILPLPVVRDYQPGVYLRLTIIRDGEHYTTTDVLNVPATAQKLAVTLTPAKPVYQPGETATFDIITRDSRGRAIPAEVGVGVVDTALYAIRPDNSPGPYAAFWPPQPLRVETDFSLAASYPGGAYQQIPPPPPPPKPIRADEGIRVRTKFEDTAYWAASVITDANGHGQISFPMPDNLTTWRATARGLTKETQAGEVCGEVKAVLPLMVRLMLPRFYISGDQATAAAIVHNYTGIEREVRVTLTADGAQVTGAAEQTVRLAANGIRRLTWTVKVSGHDGQAADDSVRFLVSADGGEGAHDATESSIPVHPDGVRRVDAAAGMMREPSPLAITAELPATATTTMPLPANALLGSAKLEVALSPSLAGPIFQALNYLVEYPYGCTEQTMDRFLPDVIVTKTLRELGAKRPEPPLLKRYVNFGVQKLLRYQHGDGGWQWWEFDESDPFMTAYVVYGLAMARDAGYPLAAGPLPRGVDYLRRALNGSEREFSASEVAYLLWALTYAGIDDAQTRKIAFVAAQRLIDHQHELDIFSHASLALALQRLSTQPGAPANFATTAEALAAALEQAATVSGTATHWTANARGSGSWLDSDVEVTAQVLQALLALKPTSPAIVPAVRWLMAARQGKSWNSTKDTAAAVLALTAYLKQAKELNPSGTVTVAMGNRTLRTITLTPESVFADPVTVVISAADLRPGTNEVRITSSGAGNLYWTAHLSYIVPVEDSIPLVRGISLRRHYRVVADDPVTAGEQPAGSMIEVTVEVIADQHYRYAVLEEPIPAGCEVIVDEERNDEGCDRREVWDNRLLYFIDYLPKGETSFSYWLRAEAPGHYRILPSTAALLYFPEVRGEGKLVRLKVTE